MLNASTEERYYLIISGLRFTITILSLQSQMNENFPTGFYHITAAIDLHLDHFTLAGSLE